MKANELMIGDWVRIDEPDKYAGATGQIQSLMYHQEDDAAYFHVFIQGKFGYVSREVCSDDIRPIPLSVDILKKNGFDQNGIPEDMQPVEERDYCDDTYVWSDFDNEVSVYWDCTTDDFVFEAHVPRFNTDGICINYVHELQNLLRLCRIKKEIVL